MTSYHHPISPPTDCSPTLSLALSPPCDPLCQTTSTCLLLGTLSYFLLKSSWCLSVTLMSTLYFRLVGVGHTTWFPGLYPAANRAVTMSHCPSGNTVCVRMRASHPVTIRLQHSSVYINPIYQLISCTPSSLITLPHLLAV